MTLELVLPKGEFAVTGKQVTFESPCDSANLTKVRIKGHTYDLVDSIGNPLVPNAFAKGAMISIILNNESHKAFIQNPSTTKYIEEWLNKALSPTFTESKTLENIYSGESLSTLFGKIAKMISSYIQGGNSGGSSSFNLKVASKTLSEGSNATVYKTIDDDGSTILTFGIPKGDSGADGKDGVSPTITVNKVGKVTTLTVVNADGSTSTVKILDGNDGSGSGGGNSSGGYTYITADKVNGVTTLTITNPDGSTQEVKIHDGQKGEDGVSPYVEVTKVGAVATVAVHDSRGVTTFDIHDGNNGATPNIQVGTVTTLSPGSEATVTRRAGSPDSAPIFDFGIPRGADGANGGGSSDGGSDGTISSSSQTITVEKYGNKTIVSINDATTGDLQSYVEILDGSTPVKGVDYFTPDEKTEIAEEVVELLPVTVDNQGYTDIIGLRRPSYSYFQRDAAGGLITVTTQFEGGKQSVSYITLENDFPTKVITDDFEHTLDWSGFDG